MKKIFKKYGGLIATLLTMAVVYGTMLALGITCPIKYITGISCPGCGMSRACFSALTLNFSTAFSYHPLWVILPPLAVALIILKVKKKEKALDILLMGFTLVMIGAWLYRLIARTNPDVVSINLHESIFARAFELIKVLIEK